MLNKVILIGRLGKDAEKREASSGTSVATFSVATDEVVKKNGKKETHTEWHRIVAFGKLADQCAEYLKKGRLVYIEGKLRTRSYEDKQGNNRYITEVYADLVKFLDKPEAIENEESEENEEVPF